VVDNTQPTCNIIKISFKKRSELSMVDTRHANSEVECQPQDDDDEDNDNSLIVAMYVHLCACM